ncbi:MAG: hypothetical protein KF764_02855 [Labilithrix sp.]|nr:hypothetical protein [Labilithrix sp.]
MASASPTSRNKRRLLALAGPLALAAAMVVYVVGQRGPSGPPLPAYTVTVTGDGGARGPGEALARLRLPKGGARSAPFEIVLRPATPPEGKVVAYGFTFDAPGAEPSPLDARVELAPEGAVRLTGERRALGGASELRVVIGEPTAIGKFVDAAARAASNTADAQVSVVSVPIDRE